MDNYREKIIRIVERELKRTEEYQQRRDEYGNEEYILGCIMVKGDAFPKEVIAHAFVEDMGLELQFQVWRDEPRIRQKQAMWYDLTLFDVEGDFFGKLEQGYSILSVSDLFHCTAWNATEYLVDEQNRDKENSCWKGMQRYLNYRFFLYIHGIDSFAGHCPIEHIVLHGKAVIYIPAFHKGDCTLLREIITQ